MLVLRLGCWLGKDGPLLLRLLGAVLTLLLLLSLIMPLGRAEVGGLMLCPMSLLQLALLLFPLAWRRGTVVVRRPLSLSLRLLRLLLAIPIAVGASGYGALSPLRLLALLLMLSRHSNRETSLWRTCPHLSRVLPVRVDNRSVHGPRHADGQLRCSVRNRTHAECLVIALFRSYDPDGEASLSRSRSLSLLLRHTLRVAPGGFRAGQSLLSITKLLQALVHVRSLLVNLGI